MPSPMNKLTRPRKEPGFTLIELMVTIIILAIVTTIALPNFRSFIVSQRIKSASFDLISSLIFARSEAIKRNAPVDVTPVSNNWQNGWNIVPNGSATILKNQSALGNGLTITCFVGSTQTTPCPTITYNGNGRLNLTGNPPSIQLATGDPNTPSSFAERCIYLDLSGRPSSKKAGCP